MKNQSIWEKYRTSILISAVLSLSPFIITLLLLGSTGAYGAGSRFSWGSLMPGILALVTVAAAFWFTMQDPDQKFQNPVVLKRLLWLFPMISIFVNILMYCAYDSIQFDIFRYVSLFLGLIFIVMGNLMPKVSQNSTFGIRIPWTLANAENWKMTHRFGGKVWVICGFIVLFLQFVPYHLANVLTLITLAAAVILPIFYSWRFYQKQISKDQALPLSEVKGSLYLRSYGSGKKGLFSRIILPAILLVGVAVLLFTGSVHGTFNEQDSALTMSATYWPKSTIQLDEIASITLDSDFDPGSRTNGLETFKLLAGEFRNDKQGTFTLYAPYGVKEAIVIRLKNDRIYVLALSSPKLTEHLYDELVTALHHSS